MDKKLLLMCICAFIVIICSNGCRGGTKDVPVISEEKKVFTYAENQAADYPTTQGAYRFAELVNKKSNGRIEIQIIPEGLLGDEKSAIEQLKFGGIDFTRVSITLLADFVPKLIVLQMPYLYKNSEHMWKVLEGEIGDDFIDSFHSSSIVALSWYDAGARNFYNSVRPIRTVEDFKGLNLRVQESELMLEVVRTLGANPIPMAYGEVYSALQTGKIDGAENNIPSYESANHYEVAEYYTIDEHTRIPELQLCSQSTWNSLTKEEQAIIKESAVESAIYERKLWFERETESQTKIYFTGCTITKLNENEKEKFQNRVKPVYKKFCSEYMDIIQAIIDVGDNLG